MTIKCYGEKQSREKELGMLSEGILVWLRKVWEDKGGEESMRRICREERCQHRKKQV